MRRYNNKHKHTVADTPAVFREQREMLQVVLLDTLLHVVYLIRADHGAQTKDARSHHLAGLRIKHALRMRTRGHETPESRECRVIHKPMSATAHHHGKKGATQA